MTSAQSTFQDRLRFIVEDVHGNILSRDLIVSEPKVVRTLSGPCNIEFKLHPDEPSVQGISFKPWSCWIHVEKMVFGVRKIIASGIIQPGEVDPESGILSVKAQGFSGYLKGIPWDTNWNPIAVDPFEIFERVWADAQFPSGGNLGVTVYPTTSGTQLLPGFSFDNEELVMDFFAIFIRAIDFVDCGDYLNKLARDVPIDYFEESTWNAGRTAITKKIHLCYPSGGTDQTAVTSFRINENIVKAAPKQDVEIGWISDIIMRGWFPGKVYSYTLSNADPDRYRRVMKEDDLQINSNERAAAWAHRRLARRQIPHYYENITIDSNHPNAPFGTWDVGDTINVQGNMPWVGMVSQRHRITAYMYDDTTGLVDMQLMAEGAFNYDPIYYPPLD
jgi:hypothetical protein